MPFRTCHRLELDHCPWRSARIVFAAQVMSWIVPPKSLWFIQKSWSESQDPSFGCVRIEDTTTAEKENRWWPQIKIHKNCVTCVASVEESYKKEWERNYLIKRSEALNPSYSVFFWSSRKSSLGDPQTRISTSSGRNIYHKKGDHVVSSRGWIAVTYYECVWCADLSKRMSED